MQKRLFLICVFLALLLAGCGAGNGGPVGAVNTYYHAILNQDADQLKSVTCASFQDTALTELDSFQGVKMELQAFSCQETGREGNATLVRCDGKIVATYGSDKMDFPLGDRVHRVENQGGAWKVCGY